MPRTWLAILLGLCSCVSRGPSRAAPPRGLTPPAPPGYYAVPGSPSAFTQDELLEAGAGGQERRLRLAPRVPPELASVPGADAPIEVRLYLPPPMGLGVASPRPLVLLSPVLGSSNLLTPTFAAAFTRRGWIAALVERKDLEFDPASSLERAEEEVRLLVLRSRQALEALLLRPDVDSTRVATFGVSAGGIVSAMLAGALGDEFAFAGHVWVLAGGPLADVLADTEEERFVRYCASVQRLHGWDREEVRRRLRAALRTDPVLLAPRVPRDGVLLILARDDASVPTRHGRTLHEALGRPALRLVPGGHRTCWWCLPWIVQQATGFLAARFSAVPR